MPEEIEYWYVRAANTVTGPFTRAELDAQRDRGYLAWFHEVSQDCMVWVSASTLPPTRAGEKAGGAGRTRRGAKLLAAGTLALTACVGLGWAFWDGPQAAPPPETLVAQPPVNPPPVSPPPPAPSPRSRDVRSAESEAEISAAVGFVVCSRTYEGSDGTKTELPLVTGTCFAISDKGYLLTNRHVVEDVSKYRDSEDRRAAEKKTGMKIQPGVWVFFFSKKPERKVVRRPATVVYQTNPQDEIDLAVLKIETGPEPLPFFFRLAPRGNEEGLKAKEVYALGFPAAARLHIFEEKDSRQVIKEGTKIEDLFQESDFEYVTERGIVNVVRPQAGKTRKVVDWIMHGAKISRGNSGGPLITRDGTVVGINTLVHRVVSEEVSNYLALGMTQIRQELARHVPAITAELAEPVNDPEKGGSDSRAHAGSDR